MNQPMRNPLLVALLLPAMEIGLLALFAARYGLASVAIEVFGTSLLGIFLLRRAGYRQLVEFNLRMQESPGAPEEILRDLLRAVSGVMLVIPGIATDLVGLALLLPPMRERLARGWTASGSVFRYQAGASHRGGAARPGPERVQRPTPDRGPGGGDVIEGEFTREE